MGVPSYCMASSKEESRASSGLSSEADCCGWMMVVPCAPLRIVPSSVCGRPLAVGDGGCGWEGAVGCCPAVELFGTHFFGRCDAAFAPLGGPNRPNRRTNSEEERPSSNARRGSRGLALRTTELSHVRMRLKKRKSSRRRMSPAGHVRCMNRAQAFLSRESEYRRNNAWRSTFPTLSLKSSYRRHPS